MKINKECPFCKAHNNLSVWFDPNVTPHYAAYVYCDNCGTCGPYEKAESREKAETSAIKAWDKRKEK